MSLEAILKDLVEAVKEQTAVAKETNTNSVKLLAAMSARVKDTVPEDGAITPGNKPTADAVAAKEANKPAPAPEPKVDYEALRLEANAALKQVQMDHGTAVVKAVLKEFGAAKTPEVKDDKLAKFIEALQVAAAKASEEDNLGA